MASKQNLKIADFDVFYESLKAVGKLTNAVKLSFSKSGLTIYARNQFARLELVTDSVTSEDDISLCLPDLSMLLKIFGTAREIHENDIDELKVYVELPFLKIESKKFKTKLTSCKEEIIIASISKKVTTAMEHVFDFSISSTAIKNICAHSFILQDLDAARIYLAAHDDMENNSLFATVGDNSSSLNNSVTLKAGLIEYGTLNGGQIILNFDRLNILNIVQGQDIKVSLTNKNVLVIKPKIQPKNKDVYCDLTVYCSILAA